MDSHEVYSSLQDKLLAQKLRKQNAFLVGLIIAVVSLFLITVAIPKSDVNCIDVKSLQLAGVVMDTSHTSPNFCKDE